MWALIVTLVYRHARDLAERAKHQQLAHDGCRCRALATELVIWPTSLRHQPR